MDKNYKSIIESILFVWPQSISVEKIAYCVELPVRTVRKYLDELIAEYELRSSGIKIIRLENSYQMCSQVENNEYVEKLIGKSKQKGLSDSTMEVLAIVAYKQPLTKGDIENMRGSSSEKQVQNLIERNLIEEKGKAQRPGKPTLYGTTSEFLRSFSISSIRNLPNIEGEEKN